MTLMNIDIDIDIDKCKYCDTLLTWTNVTVYPIDMDQCHDIYVRGGEDT